MYFSKYILYCRFISGENEARCGTQIKIKYN